MYPKPYTTHALPLEHMHPKPYTTHAWTTEHMHPKPYACPISGGLGHLLPALTPSCDPRACPISGCHATAGHTWVMLLQDIGESRYRRTSGITVPPCIGNHSTVIHRVSLYCRKARGASSMDTWIDMLAIAGSQGSLAGSSRPRIDVLAIEGTPGKQ